MEQIIQLKSMRDDALERLQNNPDFKLVNSLDALIKDLEAVMLPVSVNAVEEPVEQIEETVSETVETVAVSEEVDGPVMEEASVTTDDEQAPVVGSGESAINEELSELAAEQPGEAASAIDALEAELSQSDTGSEEIGAQPGSMIN